MRTVGPHKRVDDVKRTGQRALCVCRNCGEKWPEGGFYFQECKKKRWWRR